MVDDAEDEDLIENDDGEDDGGIGEEEDADLDESTTDTSTASDMNNERRPLIKGSFTDGSRNNMNSIVRKSIAEIAGVKKSLHVNQVRMEFDPLIVWCVSARVLVYVCVHACSRLRVCVDLRVWMCVCVCCGCVQVAQCGGQLGARRACAAIWLQVVAWRRSGVRLLEAYTFT